MCRSEDRPGLSEQIDAILHVLDPRKIRGPDSVQRSFSAGQFCQDPFAMALVDDIVRDINGYLGLQGDMGTSLKDIWKHLISQGPLEGLPELPRPVKEAAWDALRNDAESYVLFCKSKVTDVTVDQSTLLDGECAQHELSSNRQYLKKIPMYLVQTNCLLSSDEAREAYAREQEQARNNASKGKKLKRGPASSLTGYEAKGFLVKPACRSELSLDAAESSELLINLVKSLRQVALDVRSMEVSPGRPVALSAVALVRLRTHVFLINVGNLMWDF